MMYIMISESTGTSLGSWDCRCSWLILETSVLDIPTKCRKYSGIPPIAHPSLIWSSTPNHFLTIATIINITIKFTTITSIIIFFLLSSSSSIIFGWLNPRVSWRRNCRPDCSFSFHRTAVLMPSLIFDVSLIPCTKRENCLWYHLPRAKIE